MALALALIPQGLGLGLDLVTCVLGLGLGSQVLVNITDDTMLRDAGTHAVIKQQNQPTGDVKSTMISGRDEATADEDVIGEDMTERRRTNSLFVVRRCLIYSSQPQCVK